MMTEPLSRQRVLEQAGQCREIMAEKGFVILRSPLGPDDAPLAIPGLDGPEPHRYRKDMWVLIYQPSMQED
jgi:hypothetical protein